MSRSRSPAYLRVSVCAASVLVGVPPAAAAQGQWVSVGPGGGTVNAVAADPVTPGILYAGTADAGVFKSMNGASSWTRTSTGLPAEAVNALAIDPITPAVVYAGTTTGVFRTTNGGASWSAVTSGLTTGRISALAINPVTPATVYAASFELGIFRSTDGGGTWLPVNNGLTETEMISLEVDPVSPATLYAATFHGYGFKTTDGGDTWTLMLNPAITRCAPTDFAIDPQNPSTVFRACNGFLFGGIFRSTDGGVNWAKVGGADGMFSVAIDPQTPSRVYAVGRDNDPTVRVFASTDGGTTWTIASSAPKWGFASVAVDPHTGAVYAASKGGGGAHRSTDGGTTWTSINAGLHAMLTSTVALDGSSPATVHTGSAWGGAVFRSTTGAETWADITGDLPGPGVTGVAVDPQDPLRMYAATSHDGIFRTIDGGATWTPASTGLESLEMQSVAIDPSTPSTLYAGASYQLYRSTNSGANWVPVPGAPGTSKVVFAPQAPSTIYAYGAWLFRSTDGGGTWVALSTGQLPPVLALAVDPAVPTTIYAGVGYPGSGVVRSTDNGGTWNVVFSSPANQGVTSLVLVPDAPSIIFAGTVDTVSGNTNPMTGAGVFLSTDGASSWAPFNAGLTHPAIAALTVSAEHPARIYAATLGGSVFRYELPALTFGKLGPFDGAMGQPAGVVFSWGAAPGATGYEICVDGSNNDTCDSNWIPLGGTTSTTVPGLVTGLTYYWQVRALGEDEPAEADLGAWRRFHVGLTPGANLLRNGDFSTGSQHWLTYATPDPSYVVWNVTGGVFQYYRVPPPPGTANQALVFQETTAQFGAGSPIVAQFDLNNTSSVVKRISVLILDADFSDLAVCTFWIGPFNPLTFQMKTHTTKAWTNAAIYFYAATPGFDDGFLQIDNVSLAYAPAESATRTDCVDPRTPPPTGGAPSATLVTNGDFSAGLTAWSLFGQITHQIAGGVFEFYRPPGTPSGVIFQNTGAFVAGAVTLTATLQLGNSSAVRKRVTVILHESAFLGLAACTFWIPPGQPLSTYVMRSYANGSGDWADATLSVYPATVGLDEWIRLDNVTLQRTPATAIVGTECVEPDLSPAPPGDASVRDTRLTPAPGQTPASGVDVTRNIDLAGARSATLTFESQLTAERAPGRVEISLDATEWITVALIPASDDWAWFEVDLSAFAGRRIALRFALDNTTPVAGEAPIGWRIGRARVWATRPRALALDEPSPGSHVLSVIVEMANGKRASRSVPFSIRDR